VLGDPLTDFMIVPRRAGRRMCRGSGSVVCFLIYVCLVRFLDGVDNFLTLSIIYTVTSLRFSIVTSNVIIFWSMVCNYRHSSAGTGRMCLSVCDGMVRR
jgi:hypothetical protein